MTEGHSATVFAVETLDALADRVDALLGARAHDQQLRWFAKVEGQVEAMRMEMEHGSQDDPPF